MQIYYVVEVGVLLFVTHAKIRTYSFYFNFVLPTCILCVSCFPSYIRCFLFLHVVRCNSSNICFARYGRTIYTQGSTFCCWENRSLFDLKCLTAHWIRLSLLSFSPCIYSFNRPGSSHTLNPALYYNFFLLCYLLGVCKLD